MGMASTWEIFPSDLDATAEFYVGILGFAIVQDERESPGNEGYLSLRQDGVVIGASRRPAPLDRSQRRPPIGVELGLEVDDLDMVFEMIRAAGWPIEVGITQRPWGVRDFRILDPDGYYLCFREHEYF